MSGAEGRALLELNLRRETWCQVEVNPARAERRHYRAHLRSSAALLTALPAAAPLLAALPAAAPRDSARSEPPPAAKLQERRHYEESHQSQLV